MKIHQARLEEQRYRCVSSSVGRSGTKRCFEFNNYYVRYLFGLSLSGWAGSGRDGTAIMLIGTIRALDASTPRVIAIYRGRDTTKSVPHMGAINGREPSRSRRVCETAFRLERRRFRAEAGNRG